MFKSVNKNYLFGGLVGLLLILVIVAGLSFHNSSKGNNYINRVKMVTFDNGKSVEQHVQDSIVAGEMYLANNSSFFLNKGVLFLLKYAGKDETLYFFKQSGLTIPKNFSDIVWEIDGESQTGKVIVASNNKIKVRFEVTENGDYIEINPNRIAVYDKNSQIMLPQEKLEDALEMYNLAIKYGYESTSTTSNTIQRFDEKKLLNNSNYDVKYYLTTKRVKKITNNSNVILELENKSYLQEIAEKLVYLESEINNYNIYIKDNIINLFNRIELLIIAEKLNQKIKFDEKEQIKRLENKANELFNTLELKIREENKK